MDTERELALTCFALEYLAVHLDDVRWADLDDNGTPPPPTPTAEELYAIFHKLKARAREVDQVKVSYVLKDDEDFEVRVGDTLEDVLTEAGEFLDGTISDAPVVVFKVGGEESWKVATVECEIAEANPEYVRELIEERIAEIEEDVGADLAHFLGAADADTPPYVVTARQELVFLKTELAKLPEKEPVCPADDDELQTFQFTETRWDEVARKSRPVPENASWFVNAAHEMDLRYWASAQGISYTACSVVVKRTNSMVDAVVVPDTDGKESWLAPQRRQK